MNSDKEFISDEDLDTAANKAGSYIFIVLATLMFSIDVYSGYIENIGLLFVLFVGAVLFTLIQAFNWGNFAKRPYVIFMVYHLLMLMTILWLFPAGAFYIFMGVHVAYQSHYWYGLKGSIFSLVIQIAAIYLSYYLEFGSMDLETFASATRASGIIIILATSSITLLDVTRREIEKVKDSSRRLQNSSQRVSSLMNNIADGVLATDSDGKIIEFNSAALSLIDTNKDIKGMLVSEVFNLKNESDEQVDIIAQARREGRLFTRSDLKHDAGKEESILLSISVNPMKIIVNEEYSSGFTFVIRDITKQKSLEEKRDEFISVVSHELRTPVAVSEGNLAMAEIINEKTIKDEKLAESLKASHEQLVYLSALVNDLVVLSLSEQDKTELKIEEFNPKEIAKDLVESFKDSALKKDLGISESVDSDLTLRNSKLFTQEILKNFLTNAVKYTDFGQIEISAQNHKNGVMFSVTDSGKGISKIDQKHIFEKFFRSEDFQTRETGGTGLGLHVAKQLADKIDAEITFSSKLGEGSTFNLFVPSKEEQKKSSITSR